MTLVIPRDQIEQIQREIRYSSIVGDIVHLKAARQSAGPRAFGESVNAEWAASPSLLWMIPHSC